MKLPDQLGTLGDHAHRAAAFTREPAFDQEARTELSLCLLLIESIAPRLRELLGIRERATPIPATTDPPKRVRPKRQPEPLTVASIRAEVAARKVGTPRKPDPTEDEIRQRAAEVRGQRRTT